jgi:two-component system cell cycle sensor histidine kinase/response regulator CckA
MKKGVGKKPDIEPLRHRAEGRLKKKKHEIGPAPDGTDLKKLIHELQVHQIEMQNEELNRAREEIEAVLEKYTDLYDFAPVGYLTFDEKGLIVELNLTAAQLLGMERSFLVNKPFSRFITSEFQDTFYLHAQKTLASLEKETCEVVLKKKNNTPVDAQLESISTEAEGRRLIHSVLTDITVRKEANEALATSETRYRRLFETAQDGILLVDADTGYINDVNQFLVDLLGYTREDVLGKKLWEIGAFRDASASRAAFRRLKHTGYVRYDNLPLRTRDGREIDVEAVANVYKVDSAKVIQCNVRDITAYREARKVLLASEWRYKSFIELTGQLAWTTNAAGEVEEDLLMWRKYTGQRGEETKGTGWIKAIHPDDAEYVIKAWNNAVATRGAYEVEYRIRRYDGIYRDFLARGLPVFKQNGSVGEWVGTCIDITERKSSEEILHRYELLASHSRDIILFMELNGGRIVEANAAAIKAYKYSREELLTLTIYHLRASESRRLVIDQMSKAAAGGALFETVHRAKDGTLFPVEISAQGATIGGRRLLVSVIRDISRRKETEEELEKHRNHLELLVAERTTKLMQSEEKYRDLVDNALVGVYQMSLKGDIFYCNDALLHMLGFEKMEEVMSAGLSAIFRNLEDRRIVRNTLRGSGTIDHYETEFFTKNRQPVCAILSATLKGNIVSGMVLDISERKRAEEERINLEIQLRRTQKMEAIGTLAGGIAHDFNNILSGILGFTEMALEDLSPDNPVYRYLEHVMKGACRGRDLVKQILTFSRLNEQEQKPLLLSAIIDEALGLLRPALPATISIKKHLLAEHNMILADSVQMHQVVMNLCTNAAHAMRERGGTLGLSIVDIDLSDEELGFCTGLKPGVYAKLSVTDTGCGMTPEVLEEIFDPFFTTKGPGEGTGLGLSVVHGIVKGHGGHVTVSSVPGKGSTFHVYLPAVETVLSAETAIQTAIQRGEERILFVDDEEMLVELNFQRLSGLGYQVVTSTSSMDALKLFEAEPDGFDLVITDYTMPAMTGIDLAKKLLAIKPGIPVILVSGLNEKIMPEKIEEAGIRAFLSKTTGKRELAGLIRQVLDKKTEL